MEKSQGELNGTVARAAKERLNLVRVCGFVAEEDNVGVDVEAEEREVLGVVGIAEVEDLFGGEAGDLLSGRTVEWLKPEVVDAAISDDERDAFAVGSEMHAKIFDGSNITGHKPPAWIEIDVTRGGRATVESQKRQLVNKFTLSVGLTEKDGESLTVG